MLSAMYSASAWIVEVGFTPPEVTKMLPSTMNRFFTSWLRPQEFTTERAGSLPMRAVPSRCQPPYTTGRTAWMCRAPAAARISLPRVDREVQHAAGVLADGVVDPGRRDAVAVLQHRIERDPVVLLGQVLGADADLHAVADHAAEGVVVALAPGQQAVGLGVDRLGADADGRGRTGN